MNENLFEKYAIARTTDNRSEWLEMRKLGIGGSDCSIVLKVNPWKTYLELWEEKTGTKKAEDLSNKPAIVKGVGMEPLLREMFKIEHVGEYEVLEDNNTYFSIKYPFMLANVDGILKDKETGELIGLEIKTTNIRSILDWGDIPLYYYLQIQHYMIVLGLNKFILYAYIKTPFQVYLKEYEILADIEDQNMIIEAEKEFYHLVKNKIEPENTVKIKL